MAPPRQSDLARLSLLYFPFNLFTTAMLSQLLPERIEVLAGAEKGFYLALVGSGGALAATICMFVVGILSDNTSNPRGRRYPWVVGGVLAGAAGILLFPLANTLSVLMLSFVLSQFGISTALAAYEALLPDRIPPSHQSRASGWGEFFDLGGQVGGLLLTMLLVRGILNALIQTALGGPAETRLAVFVICSVCAVTLLLLLLVSLPMIRGVALPRPDALPWRVAIGAIVSWRPSQAPDFAWLYLSRSVLNLATYIAIPFLFYFVEETFSLRGTSASAEVTSIGLCFTAGGVFGALIGGWMGDFVSKRVLLYVFCSLMALASTAFCLNRSLALAHYIGFFFGIGFSAINAVDWAFATNLVPRGQEARYLSIFQTCFTVPRCLMLGIGGLVGQHFGYRTLFWFMPVILVVGMLLLTRVRERDEIPEFSLA